LPLRQSGKHFVNEYVKLLIWAAVVLGVFFFLWKKGYLARLAVYVGGTREELKKCTCSSFDELKGSTVVVVVSTLLLGLFTVVVDRLAFEFVKILTHIKI